MNSPCHSICRDAQCRNSKIVLESHVFFARQRRCPNYSVTDAHNCKDLSANKKIGSLVTPTSAKIGLHTSWLLVVDNVTRLSHVHTYQPGPGNQQWVRGQLLITQDTTSIPLTSYSIQLISVSEGMLPNHASSLSRLLPGVTDDETEKEVARSLDYQPLALASTAIHVRKVRKGKTAANFGLTDYLKKLGNGQRGKTKFLPRQTQITPKQ